jgi:hypothetical protein
MAKSKSSTITTAADSPALAQLKARAKMLQDKIDNRIPASADRKEESLERAKAHLKQVKEEIAKVSPKS